MHVQRTPRSWSARHVYHHGDAGKPARNERLTKRLRSNDGHVVVRVMPGEERLYVAVMNNWNEGDTVRSLTGLLDIADEF
jgi:hypothetical protein